MVRREDDRAAALQAAGAEVVIEDLLEPAGHTERTRLFAHVGPCRGGEAVSSKTPTNEQRPRRGASWANGWPDSYDALPRPNLPRSIFLAAAKKQDLLNASEYRVLRHIAIQELTIRQFLGRSASGQCTNLPENRTEPAVAHGLSFLRGAVAL